jgi:hypothetical protein
MGAIAALLAFAAAAESAANRYAGHTSQHESISFRLSGGYLRDLDFRIDDRCPSGHVWRIHDFNFPAIKLTRSRFDQKFRAVHGRASAEIRGRASGRRVTGRLVDRSYIKSEHDYCRGSASFRLSR